MCNWRACLFTLSLIGASMVMGQALDVQKPEENKDATEKFIKSFSEPIQIKESKPVIVENAKFVAVAQTNWKPGKPNNAFPSVAPISIQLCITNLGKSEVVFPTSGTFGVRIVNADSKEVKPRRARNGTASTRPVALAGGTSYSLCPLAELRWDDKTKASELIYSDGTGCQMVFGPLAPGRYKLAFWYSAARDKEEAEKKDSDTARWVGEAVTGDVPIEVFDTFTRGFPPANASLLGEGSEPIRIRESKLVTVNEAKFVVVAQTNWKPSKIGPAVPIQVQLRITSLSTRDLIFPTFDTFGVRLSEVDGKKITLRGGRDLTALTRPVLIPAGSSYSLAAEGGPPSHVHRRAELDWDSKAKGSELVHVDGTGWVSVFGPLEPGRYQLAFGYGVSPRGPFKTARDSATWLGEVVTDQVTVEVLNR